MSLLDQIDALSKSEFFQLLNDYDAVYYEGSKKLEPISDSLYDHIREVYEERFGEYTKINMVPEKNKVPIPYYLSSLDKKKTTKDIDRWLSKYPNAKIIDDKVDGVSALYAKGKLFKHNSNDGSVGIEVSHLIPYLNFPKKVNIEVRMELV